MKVAVQIVKWKGMGFLSGKMAGNMKGIIKIIKKMELGDCYGLMAESTRDSGAMINNME